VKSLDHGHVVRRKTSAGLLIYRRRGPATEVLLVHPGGPLWQAKDRGAWSIPKGEVGPDEEPLETARREVAEETGLAIAGECRPLTPIKQAGGKTVLAWAVEGDCDPALVRSNTFELEWPPHSGRVREFPEIDRAAWFGLDEARQRINPAQRGLLDQLGGQPAAGSRGAVEANPPAGDTGRLGRLPRARLPRSRPPP
jgi:predicted NUDIX family NTP pyrophosphohydrolase